MDKNKKLTGKVFIEQVGSDIALLMKMHEPKKIPTKAIRHKKPLRTTDKGNS